MLASMKPFIPDSLPIQSIHYASPALITAMGKANRAIAHYNALLEQSPITHLLLAPLTRREAMLSSRIEGSRSTLNEVLQFDEDEDAADGSQQRDDLQEIQNYVHALALGETELRNRPFSLNMLKDLHGVLLGRGSVRGKQKNPGAFRARQNWIGRPGVGIAHATFVPPDPLRLPEFMENWETFYHSSQPDPLVQAAMLHAQFELIHPFEDGNGRLGRLLIPLFLSEKKVMARPGFYLSACLEKNRQVYMKALRQLNTRPGDWDGWVLFFLEAVAAQAKESSEKVQKIRDLYDKLKPRIVDLTHSQFAVPLLDAMFERPVFRRATVKRKFSELETPPSDPTTLSLVKKLTENGILSVVREGSGRRGAVYALDPLIQLRESDE